MSRDDRERARSEGRRYPNGERMPDDAPPFYEEPLASKPKKACDSNTLFPAIMIMTVGAIFLLSNLGLLRFHDIWRMWPVILIVVGLVNLPKAGSSALVPLVVGVIFLVSNLGIPFLRIGTLWPLILIAVGVALVARPIGKRGRFSLGDGAFPHSNFADADNKLHEWTVFGGVSRVVNSVDFQGGQLFSLFGGIEIDLRRAQIVRRDTPVVIEANTSFGGVSIKVPDTWRVAVRGVGIFGGYVDETIRSQQSNPLAPLLVVTGFAAFGGVVVE